MPTFLEWRADRTATLTAALAALALCTSVAHAAPSGATSAPNEQVSGGAVLAAGLGGPGNTQVDAFIVGYRPGVTRGDAASRDSVLQAGRAAPARGAGLHWSRTLATGAELFQLEHGLSSGEATALMRAIAAAPGVAYVEPDLRFTVAQGARSQPFATTTRSAPRAASAPNYNTGDPYYSQQYGLLDGPGGINAGAAWLQGATGAKIRVAIVDTGSVPHSDLAGRVAPGYDFISDPKIAIDGDARDEAAVDIGDGYGPGECGAGIPAKNSSWHGNQLAGIIGAKTWNQLGVAAVAPTSTIVPIRVMGKCGGDLSDIVDAVTWAAGGTVPGVPKNWTPAHVINISLDGPTACPVSLGQAIRRATQAGVVVVSSAGDGNRDTANTYPASCAGSGAITVAATDSAGNKVPTSNSGAAVALSAPGANIITTGNSGSRFATIPDNYYVSSTGSDMSAAFVSGVIALVQSNREPDLSPAALLSLLTSTTRPFGSAGKPTGMGSGIVDAAKAVRGS